MNYFSRKGTENGTKKPSAKPENRVPRVKVLNYLKKVALFFRFERDILADGAQVIARQGDARCRDNDVAATRSARGPWRGGGRGSGHVSD